jgi:hypothetical protein
MRNLATNVLVQNALASQTIQTGATNGAAVDTGVGGNNFRDVLFAIGSKTLTDGTYAFTVEESDASGSGYAAVDSARVLGALPSFAATDDDTWKSFGVRPTKRYVRVVCTATGATSGGTLYGAAVLGSGSNHPVT